MSRVKRQRTAALQNLRIHGAPTTALASWTAPVLWRFRFHSLTPNRSRSPRKIPAKKRRGADALQPRKLSGQTFRAVRLRLCRSELFVLLCGQIGSAFLRVLRVSAVQISRPSDPLRSFATSRLDVGRWTFDCSSFPPPPSRVVKFLPVALMRLPPVRDCSILRP
jgi:hypothetical protein